MEPQLRSQAPLSLMKEETDYEKYFYGDKELLDDDLSRMPTKIHEAEGNALVRHWDGADSEPLIKIKVYGTPAAPNDAAVPGWIVNHYEALGSIMKHCEAL